MSKHRVVDCAVASKQRFAALARFLRSARRNEGSLLVVSSDNLVLVPMVPVVTKVTIFPNVSDFRKEKHNFCFFRVFFVRQSGPHRNEASSIDLLSFPVGGHPSDLVAGQILRVHRVQT